MSQKLAGAIGNADGSGDPDAADDCGSFGLLRGIRERSAMLTLRKSSGDMTAVSYAWVERIAYDAATHCITLHGAGPPVRIRGRHLTDPAKAGVSLFEGLSRQRVPWIAESSRETLMRAEGEQCVIESIEC
ncbi:MAG: hypothetical protein QM770_07575 [Tepidisphaeraceae bacterium]